MDKKAVAERLQVLAADDKKRSKTARLYELLDDVERALAAGVKRADVLAELHSHGLAMSLSTFETTLKRLRAKRKRQSTTSRLSELRSASAALDTATLVPAATETGVTPTHDPTDLDRIIHAQPDLAALTKVAKRSKK